MEEELEAYSMKLVLKTGGGGGNDNGHLKRQISFTLTVLLGVAYIAHDMVKSNKNRN